MAPVMIQKIDIPLGYILLGEDWVKIKEGLRGDNPVYLGPFSIEGGGLGGCRRRTGNGCVVGGGGKLIKRGKKMRVGCSNAHSSSGGGTWGKGKKRKELKRVIITQKECG